MESRSNTPIADRLPAAQARRENWEQPPDAASLMQVQLDYLRQMSPQKVPNLSAELLEEFLGVTVQIAKVKEPFEEVIRGDASLRNAPGCWGFEVMPQGDFRRVPGVDTQREKSIYVNQLLKQTLQYARRFSGKEYIPANIEESGKKEFKERKMGDPMVRLVFKYKGRLRFIDAKLSTCQKWLEDRFTQGNTKTTSTLELLLEGRLEEAGWVGLELEDDPNIKSEDRFTHPLDDWDSEIKKMPEPPLLVLSLTKDGQEPLRVRERGMFAHLNVHLGKDGAIKKFYLGFSHMTYGMEGLNDFLVPLIDDTFRGTEVKTDKPELQNEVKIETKVYSLFDDPFLAIASEKAPFSDLLIKEFVEKTGVVQATASLELPKTAIEFIRKNSRPFGGPIGIYTLAGLISGGTADFFPLATSDKDLQVCLGLGGVELRMALARVLSSAHNINEIKEFWEYWNQKKWREALEKEIKRGRAGHGLVTDFARVGAELKKASQKLAGILAPTLDFSRNRSMTSSLGRIPERIGKHIAKIAFYTAAGESNTEVKGVIGQTLTEQIKPDPYFAAECLIQILETEKDDVIFSFQEVLNQELIFKLAGKYGIQDESLKRIAAWAERLKNGGSVRRVEFAEVDMGNLGKVSCPLPEYILNRSFGFAGEDKVEDDLRALVFLIVLSFRKAEGELAKPAWLYRFHSAAEKVVRNKILKLAEDIVSLSILGAYSESNIKPEAKIKGLNIATEVRSRIMTMRVYGEKLDEIKEIEARLNSI